MFPRESTESHLLLLLLLLLFQLIASNVPRSDVLEKIVQDDVIKICYVSIILSEMKVVYVSQK